MSLSVERLIGLVIIISHYIKTPACKQGRILKSRKRDIYGDSPEKAGSLQGNYDQSRGCGEIVPVVLRTRLSREI